MSTKQTTSFFRNSLNLVLFAVLLLSIFTDSRTVHAVTRIRYAKPGGAVSGSCLSWAVACELRFVLASVATTGDQIWVQSGTYLPTSGTDQTISFLLKSGVAIYGGFNGTETSLNGRDPTTNVTILSGEIGAAGSSDNSYHVVLGSSTDSTAILDGFTITAGSKITDIGSVTWGGGMYNDHGSPTLTNLVFRGNTADYGGGIFNRNSNPTLTNVIFDDNTAFIGGGGMANFENSNPILVNVTFSNNLVRSYDGTSPQPGAGELADVFWSGYIGGGLMNDHSSPMLTNVIFNNNSATTLGGGMASYVSQPKLSNVTFHANQALNGGGILSYLSSPILTHVTFSSNSGSGMYLRDSSGMLIDVLFRENSGSGMINDQSHPTLTNVTFVNNTAARGGGMFNSFWGNPTLTNVAFIGNIATEDGGGMLNNNSAPTLTNVTFNGNSAGDQGGGIGNYFFSNATLTNVTFSGNNAGSQGGGIYSDNSTFALTNATFNDNVAATGGGIYNYLNNLEITNTILYGDIGGEIFTDSSTPVVTYSIVQGGHAGMGNLDADPLLGGLADNGGFTQTLALGAGSPAIDAGDDSHCPPADQRGAPRPQGSHCDIGSFESGYPVSGDTAGVFRPSNGELYLKHKNETGIADIQINYGIAADYPVIGDWDGSGTSTIGVYRNGSFYLRNSNTIGFADVVFPFGIPGDQPVAGDWNGDGVDTVGVYRSSTGTFYLRNENSTGAPDAIFSLGISGDIGLAGDWNNDGIDTTGVFRPSNGVLYLKNTNETGFADTQINYGLPGDKPVTGDWDDDGIDTIGIYRQGAFYLRNSNTIGFADIVFALGIPGDHPIAGNWDGLP